MPKPTLPTNPTATDVRARLGLPLNQRGQLSQAHIDAYNKGKRAEKRYVRGASGVASAQAKAEAKAAREALAASGVKVGTRGPLPKVSVAQPKG